MEAAHHAIGKPLCLSQILNRNVSLLHAGIEEYLQVHTLDDDDPENEPAECAEQT